MCSLTGSEAAGSAPVRRPTFVPAFRVEAVEPTGAGDAFTAAIIARSLASGWAPLTVEDVRYAAAAGALATTRPGAWDGLPNRAQLDAFLARQMSVSIRDDRIARPPTDSSGPVMPSPSDPIAFSVFGLDVRWYALFMLAGVVAGLFLARFLAGRIGLDPDWVLDAAPWVVLFSIVGARSIMSRCAPTTSFHIR